MPRSGTIAALRALAYKHVLFTGKRPATQRTLRSYIDRMAALEGDKLVEKLRPRTSSGVSTSSPTPASPLPRATSRSRSSCSTGSLSISAGARRPTNPTAGVTLPKIKGKGYRTCADDEAAAYEVAYAFGTRKRLIYEAYACTGLRRGDMARLGRQCVRPRKQIAKIGPYVVTHNLRLPWLEKTEHRCRIPILPSLQRAIDALPKDNMAFFAGPDGKPLTGKRTADILREACHAIGLGPRRLSTRAACLRACADTACASAWRRASPSCAAPRSSRSARCWAIETCVRRADIPARRTRRAWPRRPSLRCSPSTPSRNSREQLFRTRRQLFRTRALNRLKAKGSNMHKHVWPGQARP